MNQITVDRARELVKMWRQVFHQVPASVCLTLMEEESAFNADAHNQPSEDAIANHHAPPDGAWGLLQILKPTAADMVRKIRSMGDAVPQVMTDALTMWDDEHPSCLLNPELGSLLGVAYLDHLAQQFGAGLDKLAGAYHNGPGFMKRFLADGKQLPYDMPPKGKAYIIRAHEIRTKYVADDLPVGETPPTPAAPATS